MPKLSRTNTAKWDEKKGLWRIVVTRDGKRKEFTSAKPGRTGQREANKKADAWLSGTAPAERLRVRDAYRRYSEAQIGLRSTSNDKDIQTKGDTWILPYIGSKYLDALTLGDLQAILDDADRKGKSRKTIRNIRGRLSHFFRFCRQHGWTTLRTDDLTVSDHAPVKPKTILQPEALRIPVQQRSDLLWKKRLQSRALHSRLSIPGPDGPPAGRAAGAEMVGYPRRCPLPAARNQLLWRRNAGQK